MRAKSRREMVQEAKSRIKSTTVAEVSEAVANGEILVVDVREPAEWQQGHIPGAMHIPLDQLLSESDPESPTSDSVLSPHRDKAILIQCATGARSAMATDVLDRLGFKDVTNLEGGLVAWAEAGLPIER